MVSQVAALEATFDALDLRPEHEALKAYCLGLAAVIDEHPERATLWREYRPAVETLLSVGGVADEDDGQAALLELVRTPVGNAKKGRTRNAGAGGGGDREGSRAASDAVAAGGRGRRSGVVA